MEWFSMSSIDWELVVRIMVQCVLFSMSAFFSGSETALFSLSRIDLQKLRNSRNPHSESIHAMLDEPRRLIVSLLCGNELVNIAAAANMTMILIHAFGEADAGWINVVVMVPLLLLFGEVTPKTIAVNFPVKFATQLSARFLPKWILLVTPLRDVVRMVADRVTTFVVGEHVGRENILKADELRTLMADSEETGVIQASERVLIDKVLEAAETDVARIMTPGPQIRFLDGDLPVEELIEEFRSYRHPRVPVYRGHWDNVIGFLHADDLLRRINADADRSGIQLREILRPAHFVPPTKKVDEMLEYFQRFNTRAAVVIGEYGEVLGIVTMKDVLSFIFGEISGKMRNQEYYQEEDNDSFTVPGYMRLADLRTLTNFDIEDPLMNTIGGVALVLFGRLPRVGEKVFFADYQITIKEVIGMRITRVRVSRGRTPDEPEAVEDQPLELESVAEPMPDDSPAEQDREQEAFEEYEHDLLNEPTEEELGRPADDLAPGDTPTGKAAGIAE
ncbi:MAG: HlyC/CorC family transporter [Dechloromonas sp.]|uniref:HlyC/CorC family transporter n=1 Tax=Candidatus Dechloromonas phosphorivorans TaxID=2899244 RepID=A0A9D7QIY1_9RHOO|nr:HlyC/CorC family transporter [Candidatus Dechloromonas phosphorivorans]